MEKSVIKELLEYDPYTGILIWKTRDQKWFKTNRDCKAWNTRYSNKRAGSVCHRKDGYSYRVIIIFGKRILEHRLIWIYMTGDEPPEEIDHIDQDPLNNSWENLTDGSYGKNDKNRGISTRNTSGVTGVSWDKNSRKWVARVHSGGKKYYLGLFLCKDDAQNAVVECRTRLGFSPNHGT